MSGPLFNPKLESLRGLAAFAVCFTHSIAIYRMDQSDAIWYVPIWKQSFGVGCITLINAILNPSAAVIFFFVLSGYVLTQSFRRNGFSPVKDTLVFYIRRCFRILPMMWASLILIYAFSRINHAIPPDQVSLFYTNVLERPPSFHDLLKNFFLLSFDASPVTWTMRVELLGSLLIPLMACIVTRHRSLHQLLLLVALVALTIVTRGDFQYLVCFYVGAILARQDLSAVGDRWAVPLVVGGMIICTLLRLSLVIDHHPAFTLLMTSTGTAAILWGILRNPSRFEILATGPLRLLGRLSYSLYLVHPGILGLCAVMAFSCGLYPLLPAPVCNLVIFFISLTIALAISALSYRWIEQPAITLGRTVTNFPS